MNNSASQLRKPGPRLRDSKERHTIVRLGMAGSLLDRLDGYVSQLGKTRSEVVGEIVREHLTKVEAK